jgi:hypothetical protein
MPIRVEHGPNLAPIGQLAYRTGQLEYRNKRRAELERIAMQQAEMRQRAQQQQNQIAATLQGQKMTHMGALQRLQLGQQFGQFNAQQANQWKVQADIRAQENKMLWEKQVGQNRLDLAKMNAGIADQKDVQRIQNMHRQEQAFLNLNPAGEGQWLSIDKQIVAARNNQKIPPQELEGHIAQLQAQQDVLIDQVEYTYGKKNKVGYEAPDMWDVDGNPTRIRYVPGVDSTGTPIVKYKLPTSKFTTGPDGNQIETPLTAQELDEQEHSTVTVGNHIYPTQFDPDLGRQRRDPNAKGEMTPEFKAEEDYKTSYDEWTKEMFSYNSAKAKLYPGYLTAKADEETDDEFHVYAEKAMGPPPVAPTKPGLPVRDDAQSIDSPVAANRRQQRANDPNFYPLQQPNAPLPLDPIPNDLGVGEPAGGPDAFWPGGVNPAATPKIGGPAQPQVPPVAPQDDPMAGQPQPAAQASVSKEFEAVPVEYHPRKQWGDTPVKSTLEGYKMMGRLSIYAIAPEDQQAVYQERQREAKVLPWDSEERGGVSPGTIANALKNGPLEYGAKVDLSKDNSPFAAKWKEMTGSDVLVINDALMWKLLSPGLTADQQAELQQRIYTQKKEHFEYYGEPSDFPSANVQRFQQRAQGIQ